MATKGNEPHPGRERMRGTSPPQRKSPSASKRASPTGKRNDSTINSERHIPNYLKPTISSGLDPSKQQVKKVISSGGDNLNKAPTLARRRSLEKPHPAISNVQKTRISPNSRDRNIRSSSFNSKTTTPHKPLSDRLSKGSKDAGKDHHQSLHPRAVPVSVKMISVSGKKQETGFQGSDSPPGEAQRTSPPGEVNAHVADIPILEPHEDLGASMTEADESLLNAGNNSAVLPDDQLAAAAAVAVEDKVDMNLTEAEIIKGDEVQELEIVESSTVLKHQDETTADDDKIGKPEDESRDGEATCNDLQLEEHGEIETETSHPEEKVEPEAIAEVEKVEDECASKALSDQRLEEAEAGNAKGELIGSLEKESADVAKEVKQETDKTATKPEVVQGKKESAAVSNDVIEETASKLREQRKNKVKALAGAFETVISLQESK